jgi:hypothetical protein
MNNDEWNSKLRHDLERFERLARLAVVVAIVAGALIGLWLS